MCVCVSVCPGGLEAPCSNHGKCEDGMQASGRCRCFKGFVGNACERCGTSYYGTNCTGRLKTLVCFQLNYHKIGMYFSALRVFAFKTSINIHILQAPTLFYIFLLFFLFAKTETGLKLLLWDRSFVSYLYDSFASQINTRATRHTTLQSECRVEGLNILVQLDKAGSLSINPRRCPWC